MLAPITIFAFNRPDHLKKTLDALAANVLASESQLIIICDGPRSSDEQHKTNAVRALAKRENRFSSVEVIERNENYGLARNIISGVTEIINRYGSVIVLEDDLITSPYFLQFMNDGLHVYADTPAVASIVGWCFPHNNSLREEAFFLKGTDCLGWATWRRAWDAMKTDGKLLLQELQRRNLEYTFNANGNYNYIDMLHASIDGKTSSWAIRWHAATFLKNQYSLFPTKSLVFHIGCDTGTHFDSGTLEQQETVSAQPIPVMRQTVTESAPMRQAVNIWLARSAGGPIWVRTCKNFVGRYFPWLRTLYKKYYKAHRI